MDLIITNEKLIKKWDDKLEDLYKKYVHKILDLGDKQNGFKNILYFHLFQYEEKLTKFCREFKKDIRELKEEFKKEFSTYVE